MDAIRVVGARENNLRDVTVEIPKGRLTVVTGVSGSGKSSLVFDTIAAESRRQLGEMLPAFARNRLTHQSQPDVDGLENLSAAVVVDQRRIGGNARSTVGTATDIAPLLRLLYSRVATPHVGYSPAFSFNDPSGMCPRCEGLGYVADIDLERLVDRDRSLDDGAIRMSAYQPGTYRWKRYVHSGLFDRAKPLREYRPDEWDLLLHAEEMTPPNPDREFPRTGTYLGVVPRFRRDYLAGGHSKVPQRVREEVERLVTRRPCPECDGARLNAAARAATIDGHTITDCSRLELGDLAAFLRTIEHPVAAPIVRAVVHRLDALVDVGLGYLSLDRETPTLSGGEAQRITLVRQLGSSLTDLTYILDEPSAGLHPHDVDRLIGLLRRLRDKGNTVLVVEHDRDVIAAADHVVEMGPGAGPAGGRVLYAGDVAGLLRSDTATGRALRSGPVPDRPPRRPTGELRITGASLHNLRGVDVSVPRGVLTAVSGVAGSGKSTLVTEVLPRAHPEVVVVDQSPPRGSRRSNPASYLGVLDLLRAAFAAANDVPAALFSPNSAGACPSCRGRGVIETDLAFLDPVTTVCEACGGSRFSDEALSHRLDGRTIAEVLALTVDEARAVLPAGRSALYRAADVGLGYLTLGQPLTTLSGGERQRLKLAAEPRVEGGVVVLDEPTAGLHPSDVAQLLQVLHGLVERGATVVVVEHDLDVIAQADHVIELGPGAGRDGGRVVFTGTPEELAAERGSITGRHLRRRLASEGQESHVPEPGGQQRGFPEPAGDGQGPTATSAPWCRGESASSTRATARSA
ncbi:excinuclease ABC subunit UvrA [Pseudonocardia cypriaca]|uniref:UvrABC system protein A n=1 Tax=Pseudonocardia cypriaca TaxID=882449 RepID=A0A543FPV4_9PSEU|nr:excinuclease ABC subunit UvrA [Pseudonocardia cypriaca]TQM35877.1 excinuclease ABC A subunit [Pseudonocardia cypriaca]